MDNDKKERIRHQNRQAIERRLSQELSSQEIKIVFLICQEKSHGEIGEILGKSKRTIEGDVRFIKRKIGCKSTVGIAIYALRNNLA